MEMGTEGQASDRGFTCLWLYGADTGLISHCHSSGHEYIRCGWKEVKSGQSLRAVPLDGWHMGIYVSPAPLLSYSLDTVDGRARLMNEWVKVMGAHSAPSTSSQTRD